MADRPTSSAPPEPSGFRGSPPPPQPPAPRPAADHSETLPPVSSWERSWSFFDRWLPYVLLALSTASAVFAPGPSASPRGGTLVLVGLAAAWIAIGHTTASEQRREQPWHGQAYLTGLLAFAALLMARDMVFFVFAITGFLHASVLRPRPLVFAGTGATSFLILYFTWGGLPAPTLEETGAFLTILVIQTLLIGLGIVGGEKMFELNEERWRTVHDLQTTLAENEGLHAQLMVQAREAGVHDERQRLAREIHDTLAQGLTGVITQLEAADQTKHDPASLQRHLDNAAALARQSLAEARRSVQALGPGALEHGRLTDALDELARDFSELSRLHVEITVTAAVVALPTEVEIALLRVAQEALANVTKHADATRVGVTLSPLDEQVMLDVRDDGRGFDPMTAPTGASFGLTSMRQRVEGLGGTLEIESEPSAGTAISASIPIPTERGEDA